MSETVNSGHTRVAETDVKLSADDPTADESVMGALRSHLPLTLLMDLSNPQGPSSAEISETEGGDADWLPEADDEPAEAGAVHAE